MRKKKINDIKNNLETTTKDFIFLFICKKKVNSANKRINLILNLNQIRYLSQSVSIVLLEPQPGRSLHSCCVLHFSSLK